MATRYVAWRDWARGGRNRSNRNCDARLRPALPPAMEFATSDPATLVGARARLSLLHRQQQGCRLWGCHGRAGQSHRPAPAPHSVRCAATSPPCPWGRGNA